LNRGQSAAKVPEGVKQLTADRNADLGGLRTMEWDAVIDTCAYQSGWHVWRRWSQGLGGRTSTSVPG